MSRPPNEDTGRAGGLNIHLSLIIAGDIDDQIMPGSGLVKKFPSEIAIAPIQPTTVRGFNILSNVVVVKKQAPADRELPRIAALVSVNHLHMTKENRRFFSIPKISISRPVIAFWTWLIRPNSLRMELLIQAEVP